MLPTPYSDIANREKLPKKRSRLGCLTCRSRRLKCDERSPCCENCAVDKRSCTWGLKASFHVSRMHCLSKAESAFMLSLEARRHRPVDLKFVDNTEEISSGYLTDAHGLEDSGSSEIADESASLSLAHSNQSRLETQPGTARRNSNGLINEPRGIHVPSPSILNSDSPVFAWDQASTQNAVESGQDTDTRSSLAGLEQIYRGTNRSSLETSPATLESEQPGQNDKAPPWPISQYSKARLIAAYLKETATWCETTDTDRHFSLKSAHLILGSQALGSAAVAVASRQLDNMGGQARVETLELYDFARQTICSLEAWQNDELVLASVVQLCVYCMMSMEVNEWRLHLRGCAGTFQEMGWSGSSGGLPSACFWAFARIDIWAAFLIQQTTLIPTDFWIRPDYLEMDSSPLQDKYANKSIWIFARIINQLFQNRENAMGRVLLVSEQSKNPIWDLWVELDMWYKKRPPCVQPIAEVEPSKAQPFPFILFGNPSAICGNIFYHTACLLLLEKGIDKFKIDDSYDIEFEPVWHARRIGGISTTTEDHANWVNNLQPIFIAGRYCHEATEKIAMLKHLKDIENATGWKTSSRSAELRNLWGLG